MDTWENPLQPSLALYIIAFNLIAVLDIVRDKRGQQPLHNLLRQVGLDLLLRQPGALRRPAQAAGQPQPARQPQVRPLGLLLRRDVHQQRPPRHRQQGTEILIWDAVVTA